MLSVYSPALVQELCKEDTDDSQRKLLCTGFGLLMVAGVGFEKTASWKKLKQREQEEKDKQPAGEGGQLVEITDYDVEIQSIGIVEIFHYTFNYIGILTGPYYRYRTYRDYFDTPFKDHALNVETTIEKLKSVQFIAFYI
ncbi:hypothetical protein DOY81_011331 [Sarcophaga bullata]|nr:hypothetical protein DOY81_011331 [Sarcophaga bullata]